MTASTRADARLRYRRTWFALGVVLLAAVVAGSLASLPVTVEDVMLHDKWLHFAAYGALMLWFAQVFRSLHARALLAVGLIAFGIGVEYLQGMTVARQFDVIDMVANAVGVLLGGALSCTRAGRTLAAFERRFERLPVRGGSVSGGRDFRREEAEEAR